MNKDTKQAYNLWADKYDEAVHILYTLEKDLLVQLMDPRVGELILDAGCGTGQFTSRLVNSGAKVVGIDFSEGMIIQASKKVPDAEFKLMDLTKKLEFEDNYFDKIISAQALQHIRQVGDVLKELQRVMKPGGQLILAVSHPEMDRTHYKKNIPTDAFKIGAFTELYDHRFMELFDAFDFAGLKLVKIYQVPITDEVSKYFNADDFALVKGKYLGVVFRLSK